MGRERTAVRGQQIEIIDVRAQADTATGTSTLDGHTIATFQLSRSSGKWLIKREQPIGQGRSTGSSASTSAAGPTQARVTSSRIWRWLPAEVTATARYGPTQPLRRACRSGCAWPDCGRADPNDGLHDDRLLAALEDHGWAGSRQRPSTSRSSRTRKRERGRSRVPDSVSEVRSPSRSSGDTTKWTSIPGRVILRLLLAAAEELVTGHGERRHAAISE